MKKTRTQTRWFVLAGVVASLAVATYVSAAGLGVNFSDNVGGSNSWTSCVNGRQVYAVSQYLDSNGNLVAPPNELTDYNANDGWQYGNWFTAGAKLKVALVTTSPLQMILCNWTIDVVKGLPVGCGYGGYLSKNGGACGFYYLGATGKAY